VKKSLFVVGLFVAAVVAGMSWASVAQAGSSCLQLAPTTPNLESNGYFQVLAPTVLEFQPGVEFRVDNEVEVPFVEYRATAIDVVMTKSYCRCADPTGCPDDDCHWYTSGQTAECLGGCRKANGQVCLSCDVFSTPGTTTGTR